MEHRQETHQKNEEARVNIRDRMRKERMSKNRSNAYGDMPVSEADVAQLQTVINATNVEEHLSQLKYISIEAKSMDKFVWLAEPLLALALQTKQQYVFEEALTTLTNMVNCEHFKMDDTSALRLADLLLIPNRRVMVMQFYSNLFSKPRNNEDLGAPTLFKALLDANLLKFLEDREQSSFDNEDELNAFCEFEVACLIYSSMLTMDQLHKLLASVDKYYKSIEQQTLVFDLCIALSRASRDFDVAQGLAILKSFNPMITDILVNKKTRLIMALFPFLSRITKFDKAYDTFNEQKLNEAFLKALSTRNPQTKKILITLLANMAPDVKIASDVLFQSIFVMIKQFERQAPAVQASLAFFMASTLNAIPTESMLSLLINIGLTSHVRTLLQSTHNIQSINSALQLLQISLHIDARVLRIEYEKAGIPQILDQLTRYPDQKISANSGTLLDNYFKL